MKKLWTDIINLMFIKDEKLNSTDKTPGDQILDYSYSSDLSD